jgi:F0F1-type ATP synthase membrane subunit b/b'
MAMFIGIYVAVKKLTRVATSLQQKADPVIAKVTPLVEQAQSTVANVRATVEKISAQVKETLDKVTVETRAITAAVSTSSQEIVGLARQQAQQLSSTLDHTNATLQRQITELDGLLARTQGRFEDATVEVQTTLLQPLRDLSALIIGLKRTLDSLFRRDRKQIDQAYQDEEMFI